MRIALYPADEGGCGFYRVIWPARALIAQGADLELVMPLDPNRNDIDGMYRRDKDGNAVLVDVVKPDADIVVLQRPLQRKVADSVPMLQGHGVKVVVEVDDDFEAISPRNVSWRPVQPQYSPWRNKAHLARACEQADLVVVSTPALAARYGRHGRVVVVPNCVPAWYLTHDPGSHDGIYVGWSGSIETHPDDLQVTGGGVGRAVKATGANFAVVGTGAGVRRALGLQASPAATGWMTIDAYPTAVAQFDVGIVPLELSAFNAAKSALKMMEMAALGVAVMASPTPENAKLGLGLIISRARDWEGALKVLIGSADHRRTLTQLGRCVMQRHTIEGNAERWLDAWSLVNSTVAR